MRKTRKAYMKLFFCLYLGGNYGSKVTRAVRVGESRRRFSGGGKEKNDISRLTSDVLYKQPIGAFNKIITKAGLKLN